MKIKISYQAEETDTAMALMLAIRKLLPSSRIHRSNTHDPFFHVYLSWKAPQKRG